MGHRLLSLWRRRQAPIHLAQRRTVPVAVAITLMSLAAAAPGPAVAAPRGGHSASPRISIVSPQPKLYAVRTKLLARYSCASGNGIATCTATVGGGGAPARPVVSGHRVQIPNSGAYTMRVTARDRRGHRATKTVAFAAERTVAWSGYTWFVRRPGWGGPGFTHWSDTSANVRVSGHDLVLSVVKDSAGRWTSCEVDNLRHLGYGTYRWVVASDLSHLDPHQVLGLFTFAPRGAFADEIDMEASQWGNPLAPSGSVAVWQISRTHVSAATTFAYSDHPPYVQQFTWSPGLLKFLITDATGAVLLDWTVTSGVPTPSSEVPSINYWRFHNVTPSAASSVRIASFAWSPLR